MKKSLSWHIGRRYASMGSRSLLTGFISILSIAGLALGVAALVTVLSVMNGFDRELRTRVLAMVPHLTMTSPRTAFLRSVSQWSALQARIEAIDGITATAPLIQVQSMLLANGRHKGVFLQGVDPLQEREASIIEELMESGDFMALRPAAYNLIIGAGVAEALGVGAGDSLSLVSTVVPLTPLGEFTRQKQFTVAGVFRVGSQLDANIAIAHLEDVQRVYRLGDAIHGLRIQVNDLFATAAIAQRIHAAVMEDFAYADWSWDYGGIYQNILLSKALVGLLLSLLVAVAAFNVVVSLFMVVRDKRGDIAILRAMGASLEMARNIFLVQGLHIGLIGIGCGLGLGLILSLSISDIAGWLEGLLGIELLNAEVYPIDYLPSQIRWPDLLLVGGLSLLLTLLATLYPAFSAARVNPAEALRWE